MTSKSARNDIGAIPRWPETIRPERRTSRWENAVTGARPAALDIRVNLLCFAVACIRINAFDCADRLFVVYWSLDFGPVRLRSSFQPILRGHEGKKMKNNGY